MYFSPIFGTVPDVNLLAGKEKKPMDFEAVVRANECLYYLIASSIIISI